jgi:hypothetical protein
VAWLVCLMTEIFMVSVLTMLSVFCWVAIGLCVYGTFEDNTDA